MLVSYETAELLKRAGWSQEGMQPRFFTYRNGRHVKTHTLEQRGSRPPKLAAPEALDVLESEWLLKKWWRWSKYSRPNAWVGHLMGEWQVLQADSADALIAAICQEMLKEAL